jgi:death-on-curing protein
LSTQDEQRANHIAELVVQIYAIHEVMLQQSGGIPGLRDGAMLHAAVARPFATFAGQDLYSSDFEKAAALFHSLIKSHPFMDGTKRTAFAATLYFLANYGHTIPTVLPKEEVIQFCLALAEENRLYTKEQAIPAKTIAEIAEWLRHLIT